MSIAVGGNGDDGSGDHRSSHNEEKTKVEPPDKPKKMSTLARGMLCYLQEKHIDVVAAGHMNLLLVVFMLHLQTLILELHRLVLNHRAIPRKLNLHRHICFSYYIMY
jgi:folate-dependent phosphoribosylglycinamide formyltransferase PurN